MAVSKNKRVKKGKTVSGKQKKDSKKDVLKRRTAYFKKQEEFGAMTDKELLALHNTGTVKGGYLVALETVIAFKAKASIKKKAT